MAPGAARNITIYPWYKLLQNLIFWQAVWFLFFQTRLSAAEAILLYAVYDIATTTLEVPSGYMSDRLGRRVTLIASALCAFCGAALLALGDSFAAFAAAQMLIGAAMAFASGTDSALLYESLAAEGRTAEIEEQELRAWRAGFAALALSAVAGGVLFRVTDTAPFWASTIAAAGLLGLTIGFRDPARATTETRPLTAQLTAIRAAAAQPVLRWIFGLSVLMYGFSHLPFIFGQPFILEALARIGLAGEAPLISGGVSATMMLISLAVSMVAPRLRRVLGLAALLLLAFAMQIGLSGMLALTNSVLAIALLFLRMVPDSLSRPFINARVQPLLSDDGRATYLSVQSFCGRLLFAGTLVLASLSAPDQGEMAYAEIQWILGCYVLAGIICFALLLATARRAGIEPAT